MILIALAGSLCLIILKIVPWETVKSRTVVFCLLGWAAGLGVGAALIQHESRARRLLQNAPIVGYLKYNLEAIHSVSELPANIVFLEGGSHGALGVNSEKLSAAIQSKGYPALVLQFCTPGADHFERYWALKRFFEFLPPKEAKRLAKRNVILLREMSLVYDRAPLPQLKNNKFQDRALSYLQPDVCPLALQALSLYWDFNWRHPIKTRNWPAMVLLSQHGALNALNIGMFNRASLFSEVQSVKPVFDYPRGDAARYMGIEKLLTAAKKPEGWAARLDWQRLTIDRKLAEYFPATTKIAYFVLPTFDGQNLIQAREYRKKFPAGRIFSFQDDLAFIKAFDDARYWFDPVHLSAKGADMYTQWLADRILKSGLLQQ